MWEPSQVGAWLGFHFEFSLSIISVPHSKITNFREASISRVVALPISIVNAKDLSSIAGQLNSMFLAIANIVLLMTRSMYAQFSAQRSWFSTFHWNISLAVTFGSNPVQSELLFRIRVIPDMAVILLSWGLR